MDLLGRYETLETQSSATLRFKGPCTYVEQGRTKPNSRSRLARTGAMPWRNRQRNRPSARASYADDGGACGGAWRHL